MSEDAPETPVAPDDTTPPPPVVPDPPAVPDLPLVDTGKLITLTADPAVSAALTAQGFLTAGGDLRSAYAAWQTSLGYDGDTADGVPDLRSLRCLAQAGGFRVSAWAPDAPSS